MPFRSITSIALALLLMPIWQLPATGDTGTSAPAKASPGAASNAQPVQATPGVDKDGNVAKKAGDEADPTPQKKQPSNRRWLIKQRDRAVKAKPGKAIAVKWASAQQQSRCEALLPGLRESFDRARYYSIQGDSCKTADHASQFLQAYQTCISQCPDNYLKGLGYSDLIPRNMQRLVDLGQERCQGRPKLAPGKPVSPTQGAAVPAKQQPTPP